MKFERFKFYILGSSDPEMAHIEGLLRCIVSLDVVLEGPVPLLCYASDKKGNRVDSRTAKCFEYVRTHSAVHAVSHLQWDFVLTVECVPKGGYTPAHAIDHNSSCGPDLFFEGSTIGQVYRLIGLKQTKAASYIAASDHCLHHAYAGRCPGVDPEQLLEYRLADRARFQKIPLEALRNTFDKAVACIRKMPIMIIGGMPVRVIDHVITEANEAAAWMQMSTLTDMGNGKVVLLAAPPDCITSFKALSGLSRREGYVAYGDPHRGIAGGYLVNGLTFGEFVGRDDGPEPTNWQGY